WISDLSSIHNPQFTIRNGISVAAAHRLDVLAGQLAAINEAAAQVTLALAALVAVQVLLTGLAALQETGRGHAKALLLGLVGLNLGHKFPLTPAVCGGKKENRPPADRRTEW